MKKIRLNEERREVPEQELVRYLDVPMGYRLTSVALKEQKDARYVEIVFVKFESASTITIDTAIQLAKDEGRWSTEEPAPVVVAAKKPEPEP